MRFLVSHGRSRAASTLGLLTCPKGMTDPNAAQDIAPPKPPRPSAAQRQLEADELYARQLAEHYNRRAPQPGYDDRASYDRRRRGSDVSEEREYSFFDGMLL